MTIRTDELAKAITDILEDYEGATFDVIKDATDEVAKQVVEELQQTSPRSHGKRTSGDYAKGWKQKRQNVGANRYSRIAYNYPHYRLTHLLEYGHALPQGGRAKAEPHIAQAEQNAIRAFEQKVKRGIEQI